MTRYPWRFAKQISKQFVKNLKERSNITLRLWVDHCEYILAQRFRRSQQISYFYYQIWGEHALRNLLLGFRKQLQRHVKGLMLSSVGVYVFDWDTERIKYDNIKQYFNEIDFVEKLKQETLICIACSKRKIITEKFDDIEYCTCSDGNGNKSKISESGWEPYIERKGMIIWRKEEKCSLYAYKVHAKYDDITANDFLHVQTDIEYRKQWDDTAISLEIIDADPIESSKSHIIYWEMRWPKLFANRDYVYNRRHFTDNLRNLIVICNKSIVHPNCPINPNKQRVESYWSYMVIKPFSDFKEPGLEFVLTYFDDPGLAIPSTITSWVAQKQMPEFLNKLYLATQAYAKYKQDQIITPKRSAWESFQTSEAQPTQRSETERSGRVTTNKGVSINTESEEIQTKDENVTSPEDTENIKKKTSWWSYLHPNYYFA